MNFLKLLSLKCVKYKLVLYSEKKIENRNLHQPNYIAKKNRYKKNI